MTGKPNLTPEECKDSALAVIGMLREVPVVMDGMTYLRWLSLVAASVEDLYEHVYYGREVWGEKGDTVR